MECNTRLTYNKEVNIEMCLFFEVNGLNESATKQLGRTLGGDLKGEVYASASTPGKLWVMIYVKDQQVACIVVDIEFSYINDGPWTFEDAFRKTLEEDLDLTDKINWIRDILRINEKGLKDK